MHKLPEYTRPVLTRSLCKGFTVGSQVGTKNVFPYCHWQEGVLGRSTGKWQTDLSLQTGEASMILPVKQTHGGGSLTYKTGSEWWR